MIRDASGRRLRHLPPGVDPADGVPGDDDVHGQPPGSPVCHGARVGRGGVARPLGHGSLFEGALETHRRRTAGVEARP